MAVSTLMCSSTGNLANITAKDKAFQVSKMTAHVIALDQGHGSKRAWIWDTLSTQLQGPQWVKMGNN